MEVKGSELIWPHRVCKSACSYPMPSHTMGQPAKPWKCYVSTGSSVGMQNPGVNSDEFKYKKLSEADQPSH